MPSERDKIAIKSVRTSHATWDKARREWAGVIELSKQSQNTRGCKFELDLAEAAADCASIDAELVETEKTFLLGRPLADAEIKRAAEKCKDINARIKASNKKSSAIKKWATMQ